MTAKEIIIALMIHLIIPSVGLFYFLRLKKQMKSENIENALIQELFLIFATYGGLLLILLTTLFWKWSGLASLGMFYLILGAPIIMGIIANSYFAIAPLIILILFLVSKN
jgi:hypothetical protein